MVGSRTQKSHVCTCRDHVCFVCCQRTGTDGVLYIIPEPCKVRSKDGLSLIASGCAATGRSCDLSLLAARDSISAVIGAHAVAIRLAVLTINSLSGKDKMPTVGRYLQGPRPRANADEPANHTDHTVQYQKAQYQIRIYSPTG